MNSENKENIKKFILLSIRLFVKIKKHEYTCLWILYLCRLVVIKEEAGRGY